jgi:hypothetical protein
MTHKNHLHVYWILAVISQANRVQRPLWGLNAVRPGSDTIRDITATLCIWHEANFHMLELTPYTVASKWLSSPRFS